MEENKFEKNIRREMEEMKITPSERAWENVEKRIKKKKDRRLLPFYFLLLALLLGSGGYWFWNAYNDNGKKHIALIEKSTPTPKPLRRDDSADSVTMQTNMIKGKEKETKSKDDTSKILSEPNVLRTTSFNNRDKRANGAIHIAKNKIIADKSKSNSNEAEVREKQENSTIGQHQNVRGNPVAGVVKETGKQIDEKNEVEESIQNNIPINRGSETTADVDSNAIVKVSDNSKMQLTKIDKRWTWGFHFSVGRSDIERSFLSFQNVASDYFSVPQNMPGGSIGSGNPITNIPSAPKGDVAFGAGATIGKNISKQTRISIGLNYKYYSITNKVGERINTSNAFYYSNSLFNSNIHRNQFHLFEIPVFLDVRLTPKNKLPVYWNAGIHILQLIATNALQFKTDRYYQDNSLFNKTQLGMSTGFYVSLFSKNRYAVNIGPYIYYGASAIAKEGLYNKKHFSFWGVRAAIELPNKK